MMHKKPAKSISYGNKRSLNDIKYIVIHYTGNNGDTAKGNANYFATANKRQAGAHFFVDKSGTLYKSVNMNRIAWAVGGFYDRAKGAAKYYKQCTNSNSISIELCDCCNDTNWEQLMAVRQLVLYIQKKCPHAKTIIRHWDVNGKNCPAPMIGSNNKKWSHLHSFLTGTCQFQAKVLKKAAVRYSDRVTATNKTGIKNPGDRVKIDKMSGNWGHLKEKDKKNRSQWISLSKIKEI